MPWNKDGSRKKSALYKKSGFKMKGNPFKRRDFGTYEEQAAKAKKGWEMAKEDYDSGYKEGIRNVHHPKGVEGTIIGPTTIEPKKKKWYQRKPKGERNRKTWWNPFD